MGYKPENTLASFAHALDMGCTWLELDVYVVEDEVVVIHDETLERTTNGRGKLGDKTLAYVRSLDAGDGQHVPLLREVIDLVDHQAVINIELKGDGTARAVSELLGRYCAQGASADEFLLSSFRHDELAKADPAYRRGALFGRKSSHDYFTVTDKLGAYSLNLDLAIASRETVEAAHERGLKVFVYTVNEPDDIARMRAIGVDGVFTNYPDRVIGVA
ncbi:MAG: hypothetical protein KDI19_15095 [Pseudomonadales bacterium]|nr:hypothetical protein [Pseudomonadales bacterium]